MKKAFFLLLLLLLAFLFFAYLMIFIYGIVSKNIVAFFGALGVIGILLLFGFFVHK